MADKMIHAHIKAGVKLDLNSLGIAGNKPVFQVSEVTVQTDNIQPHIGKHGQVLRSGPQMVKYVRIGVRRHHIPQLMSLPDKVRKLPDNFFFGFIHRQHIHGMLQMRLVMEKFYEYFEEIFSNHEERFIEAEGRRIFLMYLRPIINGSGNYYIEAQTRDRTRTDVIVDYKSQRFVIEMKLW